MGEMPPTEGEPEDDLPQIVVNRLRAAAASRGLRPGVRAVRRKKRDVIPAQFSDGRDPVSLGEIAERIMAERGWQEPLRAGGVMGNWEEIVGQQIAENCVPESLDDNGILVVRARTTAWATQMKLLTPKLLRRIEKEVGPEIVIEVRVLGPAGPSWGKGKRRVKGRGPRDTYG